MFERVSKPVLENRASVVAVVVAAAVAVDRTAVLDSQHQSHRDNSYILSHQQDPPRNSVRMQHRYLA